MSRRVYRDTAGNHGSSSSSDNDEDEEDAFAALSNRAAKRSKLNSQKDETNQSAKPDQSSKSTAPTNALGKRHHSASSGSESRKQKLDALVKELSSQTPSITATSAQMRQHSTGSNSHVRGSFVQPGEEHLTTNLFVGNLPPSVTEEEVGHFFRQFGELFSVKIMYPRSAEERSRNRHTGFVCFYNRQDALDALTACNERDVFSKGHRLQMNWGRRVDMLRGNTSVQTSRLGLPPVMTSSSSAITSDLPQSATTNRFDLELHDKAPIRVRPPADIGRVQLISTVASFVAKDGAQLEQHLLQSYHSDQAPWLSFLPQQPSTSPDNLRDEHIYYKWRVFSFAQGDTWHVWKTDPFQMLIGGCFWIPPPLEEEAARREQEARRADERELERQKQLRRMQNRQLNLLTGRQLENKNASSSKELGLGDRQEFDRLTRKELCSSKQSIQKAMVFCFEKSAAADQIAGLLRELLLETAIGDEDVDLVTARVYLLSDILFNSQQPGVKNAFRYRDAIERMAPDIFDALYRYGRGLGRMTLSKLARSVRNVLLAWQEWDVFNIQFLEELRARFDGQEVNVEEFGVELEFADAVDEHYAAEDQGETTPPASNSITVDNLLPMVPTRPFEHLDEEENVDGEPFDDEFDGSMDGLALVNEGAHRGARSDGSIDGESIDGEPLDDSQLC